MYWWEKDEVWLEKNKKEGIGWDIVVEFDR